MPKVEENEVIKEMENKPSLKANEKYTNNLFFESMVKFYETNPDELNKASKKSPRGK